MSSHIDQLPSELVKTTTTTTAMDGDTTTLSSSPGVPTPTSSTPAPKTEILVHAPECEMAIESKEKCPDGGNCADCQLNQLHSHAEYWALRADCTCGKKDDDPTSAVDTSSWRQPRLSLLDELIVGHLMEPGTLESARQHVGWLAQEIDDALGRATKNLAAGMRPRRDDAWIINEAGTLLSRLVPRMGGPTGGFSLDYGQVYAIPDAVWQLPAPPIPAGEMDHSGMARRKMEVFSSRVGNQLEARKEEQQRSARPLVGDWLRPHPTTTKKAAPESAPPSTQVQQKAPPEPAEVQSPTEDIAPKLQKQLGLNEKKYLKSTEPLVVNGSTPYPKTTTTTTTEAATLAPSATHAPEKQPSPEAPSAQTPAKDLSSFIEKQIELIEQEEQRRTRTPVDNRTFPNHFVKSAVTRVASQLRDKPGHQYPPKQQQHQQHEQPLNSNLDSYPTPDASEPISPARGQVLRFPPPAIPHPGPYQFAQGGYAFGMNPPITGSQQTLGGPVPQTPENAPPPQQPESPPAPRRVDRPFIGGLMLPPPPPPLHALQDPFQATSSVQPTMWIPQEERSRFAMLPTVSTQPRPQHPQDNDLQAQRQSKWSWARENQFWTPPGGNVRAYAHVCAEFLGLPPPSDHHIFGHEHGHL